MHVTRTDAVLTLAGLLLLLRNTWSAEGHPRELTLRHEIAEEVTRALEVAVVVLEDPALEPFWPVAEAGEE